jgi:uncharacterized protein
MINSTAACKYHSYQSSVNMKLEQYQHQELHFASKIVSFMAYCPITQLIMDSMLALELLQILACPCCKGELILTEDGSSLHCKSCSKSYPIVEGVPILLPDQAAITS